MRPKVDFLEQASRYITLGTYGVCFLVAFAAPVLGLGWRLAPFPGFLVDHTLVVNNRSGEGWNGREAGLNAPQVVTRIAGHPVATPGEFADAVQMHSIGDKISVFTRRPEGTVRLYPTIRLQAFPAQSFIELFWLPYGVGMAYFAIGLWIFLARGRDRSGRALAFFCACVSLSAALLFDVLTTHVLTAVWVSAVAFLGGALISLAMRFPVESLQIRRWPWLLSLPYAVSLTLAVWAIVSLGNTNDPWVYLAARSTAYRFTALACFVFFGVMFFRAAQGRESAIRRQARLVLVGGLFAFTPIIVWFLAPAFGVPLLFNSLLILPGLLLFPITVAVAITRYRLLEIDDLVNRAIVYGLLTAVLAGVFTAAIALSQKVFVAMTGEESDAAIVLTTLIVASVVSPVRSLLQTWVDRQFREVPTGALRSFGEQVGQFLQLNDADMLAHRLLGEAVSALGAEAGAVVRVEDGHARTVHTHGPWRGEALLSVPLASGGRSFGAVLIGPRRNGLRYRRSEAEALSEVAEKVARAMAIAELRPTQAA
ncbi:MAG TPA: hypothetical protein VFI11_02250 [Anaerolineales bacterium]|nr:hypothetical protein [Anaerolineales bacterium]